MHVANDGYTTTKHFTFLPVAESILVGTITAPDGTQKSAADGPDALILPDDHLPTDLDVAMYYARRGKRGLSWQPARFV